MPELLREMIEDLLSCEADMIVLGRSDDASAALASACSVRADMLIMQAETEATGLLDAIVCARPFSIFAISASGADATAVKLVHEAIDFDESSRTAFASTIRRVARTSVPAPPREKSQWPG